MARGWESKSIESQQDDAARRGPARPALTDAQRAVLEQRKSLELARARISDDLSRATLPQHRGMLEQALADVDAQLSRLS